MENNRQFVIAAFENYADNKSDIYEIKYLLKQFIAGDSENILKEFIAVQLSSDPFPQRVDPQTSQMLDSALTRILKHIE